MNYKSEDEWSGYLRREKDISNQLLKFGVEFRDDINYIKCSQTEIRKKFLILWIIYFGRYPSLEESKLLEILQKTKCTKSGLLEIFKRLQKYPAKGNIQIQIRDGICVDLQSLKLGKEFSGIPFVTENLIKILLGKKIKIERLILDGTFKIFPLNISVRKNRKVENNFIKKILIILLAGIFASYREIQNFFPRAALKLKVLKNFQLLFNYITLKMNFRVTELVVPYNLKIISPVPILNRTDLELLSIFSNAELVEFVPIIHDVLPISHHELFPVGAAEGTLGYIKLCSSASTNFVVSTSTKVQLIEVYKLLKLEIPTIKIFDIKSFVKNPGKIVVENLQPIYKKYFLYISTFEPRKNHVRLLLVFEKLKNRYPDVNLVLVGNYGWKNKLIYDLLESSPFRESIFVERNISEIRKYMLIKNSLATLYLSKFEGFGLPILESIISNKNVIFDHSRPMSDNYKFGKSIMIDTQDMESIFNALVKILEDTVNTRRNINVFRKDDKSIRYFLSYILR
jgi:glycosyltransferase involved in cell wall biosynthesis